MGVYKYVSALFWVILWGSSIADELGCLFSSELSSGKELCVTQRGESYGLSLKFVVKEQSVVKSSTVVKNAFGVVAKDNPSVVLMCDIMNGTSYKESFQVLDLKSFKSVRLNIVPYPLSDELVCMVDDTENYFLIFDNFPEKEVSYIFDRKGSLILKRKVNNLEHKIRIGNKLYEFHKGIAFGGFSQSDE